jgi:hypothetical protein
MDFDTDSPIMPPKVKTYADAGELLAKLDGKAALWDRTARENKERSQDFERAAQEIRDGASTVTVGRTTYVLGERTDTTT